MTLLQVSVDLLSIEQGLNLLKGVAPYIDIIEAGTPLIKQEGLRAVEVFKKAYPRKIVFADMKTMDAGALEAEMAFKAGADVTTVLGVASDATIQGGVSMAKQYQRSICADMITIHDRGVRAKELFKLGVNYLEIHSGLDEQAKGSHANLYEVKQIKSEIPIRFSVAGGINEKSAKSIQQAGADVIVVGGAIYNSKDPVDVCKRLRSLLDEIQMVQENRN